MKLEKRKTVRVLKFIYPYWVSVMVWSEELLHIDTPEHPAMSVGRSPFYFFGVFELLKLTAPAQTLKLLSLALSPAHLHATGVAVYPALFHQKRPSTSIRTSLVSLMIFCLSVGLSMSSCMYKARRSHVKEVHIQFRLIVEFSTVSNRFWAAAP